MHALTRLASCLIGLAVLAPVQAAPDATALRNTAKGLFQPIPDTPPKEVRGLAVTEDQKELGKWLFFDPRLSRSHILSCNSCHSVGTGGADNIPTSIGHGWQRGPRNSPTVYNSVFNIAQFWDGRAADLKEQAMGPVQASVEMNNTPAQVEKTLASIPQYVDAFKRAFPGEKNPVTFENMARAIEAFETTLITPGARFDKFLAGENTLNAEELQGLRLFVDKGCVACHSGKNFGGQAYFPFGVIKKPGAEVLPAEDKGRFTVTNTASDEYVFRAAPLRNVALTAPYFHSGEVWELEQAVAIMGSSQLGHELNDKEVGQIASFLRTLSGNAPDIVYPILPPSTAATPKPQH